MNWWGWVVGGGMMLGAELGLVNAQFYLVILGASAMSVGLIKLLSPGIPDWAQWAIFAVLAVVLMLGIRAQLYTWLHAESPELDRGRAGGLLTLPNGLAPGASCQAEHAGTFWTVLNDTHAPIAAGCRVRVERVQGLTLLVRPE
jgi:membrane protein implicated in regulation of membrane protease activity